MASFQVRCDTQAVMIGDTAGETVISLRYEGSGTTQGYDEDTAPCTVIDVAIESAPPWVLSGDDPQTLVSAASPDPGETGGTLQWALLDEGDQAVNWATFDPNNTAAETTLFSVSTSDSGPFTLRVGYTVSDATAYDSRLVEVISGDVTVVPSIAFVSPGATFPYEALNAEGNAYDSDDLTWSVDEGSGSVDADGLYTASSSGAGRMVVKATVDGTGGLVYDTAGVVDRRGFTPVCCGPMPPQLLGITTPHVTNQEMVVEAGLAGDWGRAYQALINDPLCSHLAVPRIRRMGRRLLEANKRYLPQFFGSRAKGRSSRPDV